MNPAQHAVILIIRVYQRVLSPMLGSLWGPAGQCRFTPSCSEYAREAVEVHGAAKGGLMAAWRLCRCQPWGGFGHDPVPERRQPVHAPDHDLSHRPAAAGRI